MGLPEGRGLTGCGKPLRHCHSEPAFWAKNPGSVLSSPTPANCRGPSRSIAFGGLALGSIKAWAGTEEKISRTAESIHQETVFKANRKRVYEALTDAQQFNKVTQISAAMDSSISLEKAPTQISREVGGAFSLFGGIIVGRHIELVPNERIVQAW